MLETATRMVCANLPDIPAIKIHVRYEIALETIGLIYLFNGF